MTAATLRWRDGRLDPADDCELTDVRVVAADVFRVDGGRTLALDAHRARFAGFASEARPAELSAFWDAVVAAVPRDGAWRARVELRRVRGRLEFQVILAPTQPAPRGIVLTTHQGPDPRREPRVKGPDLERLLRVRSAAQQVGADEAVLLCDGAVADGTASAIAWWHADSLVVPSAGLPRVESVTLGSLVALATALGVDVQHDVRAPHELDGHEVWALSAQHGVRLATAWVDGPRLAAEPGRIDLWRARLGALARPLPEALPAAS